MIRIIFAALLIATVHLSASVDLVSSESNSLLRLFIEKIEKEPKTITIVTHYLPHRTILKALQKAKGRGVEVVLILNRPDTVKKTVHTSRYLEGIHIVEPSKDKIGKIDHRFCEFSDSVWVGEIPKSKKNHQSALLVSDKEVQKKCRQITEALVCSKR